MDHCLFWDMKKVCMLLEFFWSIWSILINFLTVLFVLIDMSGTVRIFKMDANFDEKWKKIEDKFTSQDLDDDDDE